uniref:Ovule protein n=1 Tax=Heterorhabditis bacteriophora TaxID=37862 RepID=A0A1I7W9Z3_HETBA
MFLQCIDPIFLEVKFKSLRNLQITTFMLIFSQYHPFFIVSNDSTLYSSMFMAKKQQKSMYPIINKLSVQLPLLLIT